MAGLFNASRYLTLDPSPVTSQPCTLSIWIKTSSATMQTAMSVGYSIENHSGLQLNVISDGRVNFQAAFNSVFGNAITAGDAGVIDGEWHHICGVAESSSSRKLYVDGTQVATNTQTITPTMSKVAVGMYWGTVGSPFQNKFNGSLAETSLYNVALSAGQVASLASRFRSSLVQPAANKFDLPLGGFQGNHRYDLIGRQQMTESGGATVYTSHVELIYPQSPSLVLSNAGGGGGGGGGGLPGRFTSCPNLVGSGARTIPLWG